MRRKNSDYITFAGIFIAITLMLSYVIMDYLKPDWSSIIPRISPSSSLPGWNIPGADMGWFNSMDAPSKLIFCFLMVVVVATAIGCVFIYLRYRKTRGGK